jgi:hypothetical protein
MTSVRSTYFFPIWHDGTFVPDGMHEHECHSFFRLHRQVGTLAEYLLHVGEENVSPHLSSLR